MSRRRFPRFPTVLAVMVTAIALLSLPTVGVAPAQAKSSTIYKKAPSSSVARPIPGEAFTLSGSLGRSVSRWAVLQRKSGTKWVRAARARIPASGKYRFSIKQPNYRTSWRVIARKTKVKGHRYKLRKSRVRTLTRISQTGAVSAPAAVKAGAAVSLTASFSPARKGRAAQIQVNTGSGWKTVASGKQGSTGRISAQWQSPTTAVAQVRAITSARSGAGSLTTGERTLAVLSKTPVQISAHRGYSSKFAENSWHAFLGAMQERTEWIETDFRLSAPNPTEVLAAPDPDPGPDPDPDRPKLPVEPACAGPAGTRFWVILHDPTLARTTDVASVFPGRANNNVSTFTCTEIKQLRVDTLKNPRLGDFGVLTLAEFIEDIRGFETTTGYNGQRIMVEYKGGRADDFADLYDQVKELAPDWIDPTSHNDRAVFTTFNYTTAFAPLLDPDFRADGTETANERLDDGAEIAAILNEASDPLPTAPVGSSTHWLQAQIEHNMLTKARVAAARKVVDQIVAWTPKSSTSIQRAAALGADVITTGDVPLAKRALLR